MQFRKSMQIISLSAIFIAFCAQSMFAQRVEEKSGTKIGKFYSSINALYNLHTFKDESPFGFHMKAGLNFDQYNRLTIGLMRYGVYALGDTIIHENETTIIGSGGVGYFMLGLNYDYGLGSLTHNTFWQNVFLNGGLYVVDYSELLLSIAFGPEYRIPISRSMSIPIGLVFVWPVNSSGENEIKKWDFIGVHAGIAFQTRSKLGER